MDFSEHESWTYWLEDNECDITKDQLKELIRHFNISHTMLIPNQILKLYDTSTEVFLEYNSDNETFDVWAWNEDKLSSIVHNMHEHDMLNLLGIEEKDVYIGAWECTIGELCETGGTVYHYTTEEKWEEIQETDGMHTSYGTGLTNRNASGIFTSISPEEYADGTYGDICLELDLSAYKADNNLAVLDLSPEPEVLESEIMNVLFHKLQAEDQETEPSRDMSGYTVIVGHSIPLKYIKEYGN